jgi:hypothetical protein
MRVRIIHLTMLALASILVLTPAEALFDVGFMGGPVNIGIPYVAGPGFSLLSPFSQGGYIMNEARTNTLANTFAGSLAISFQPDGLASGGFPAISPAIAQTTSQSTVATRSYFFNDFLTGA